ncbi:hypothetical protein HUJ05_000493 [Dendroctonus ponderosae]|nr:hypothetical protein HUJ05_000493 [Dendroctonus ponderosae]
MTLERHKGFSDQCHAPALSLSSLNPHSVQFTKFVVNHMCETAPLLKGHHCRPAATTKSGAPDAPPVLTQNRRSPIFCIRYVVATPICPYNDPYGSYIIDLSLRKKPLEPTEYSLQVEENKMEPNEDGSECAQNLLQAAEDMLESKEARSFVEEGSAKSAEEKPVIEPKELKTSKSRGGDLKNVEIVDIPAVVEEPEDENPIVQEPKVDREDGIMSIQAEPDVASSDQKLSLDEEITNSVVSEGDADLPALDEDANLIKIATEVEQFSGPELPIEENIPNEENAPVEAQSDIESRPNLDIINQKYSWEFRARASEVYDFAASKAYPF